MRHEELTELISAYVNDEVSGTQREFVEEHLVGCPECQEKLAEFKQTRSLLTSLKVAEATGGVRERTMTAIRAESLQKRTTPRWLRPVAIGAMALVAALAVFIAAQLTGGGSDESLIARAHDVFEKVESYRMTGTTNVESDGQSSEIEFEWAFSGSDRASGTIRDGDTVSEFIIIGGDQYSRSSDGGFGGVVVTDDVLSPLPTRAGTLNYLESLEDARELKTSVIDGVSVRHFTGSIDIGEALDEHLAGLDESSDEYRQAKAWADIQRQTEINVDLFIAEDDGTLKRLELDIRSPIAGVTGGSDEPQLLGWMAFSTTANYGEFDGPVQIERPVDANGDPLPGWNAPGSEGEQAPVIVVE